MMKNGQDKTVAQTDGNGVNIDSISKRAGVNWIMLIYFLSGACSLIDEVIWVRLLKLTLGNTVYASSIVVSMFMGGLALGAFIMSRFSDRIKKRLRLYAILETLITISALAIPFALKAADNFYVWFYRSNHPSGSMLMLVQVLVSAAILLVPSILMGSTLPLLGRFVTAFEKEAGHLVGRLYALNTLGAALGCFLAGFFFIRHFGIMGSLYIAAILNLIVAFGGWNLSRKSEILKGEAEENAAASNYEPKVLTRPDGKFYILIIAFFMSGLISISYELLWMRSIIHLLSGFTYVFSSVLTIYLLGNVIGTAIGSSLVKTLKRPALGFGVTLFLLGLCGIFYLPVMILWSTRLMPRISREVELANNMIHFSTFMIKPLVQSAFLYLVPSIIMGIGFPIALQAWTNQVHKVGRSTGTAYAANTIGAVIGGIVTGFVLIPLAGLQFSIIILGLTGIWIAGLLCLFFAKSTGIFSRFGLITGAAVFTIIAFTVLPSDMFETIVGKNPELLKQLKLLEIKEGTTTTVSVLRNTDDDTLYLYTSGQRVAGDTFFWRSDQKMLGHFGIMLNKHATKALSVGFGSGETTACFSLHDLERADCAEIAPEMVDMSLKYFKHINLGDQLNDKINMIYMDAKNYLHLTDIKYDAIMNDSIHPRQFADNASLYTKEYYQSALDHLDKNGMFLSWIPTQNVETDDVLNSIIGTQMEVFPYVTIWYMTPSPALYYLVVGSAEPQYFSPKYMDEELSKEGVKESLSLININNSMDMMSCYIGDANDLRRVIDHNYKTNSDYTPYIEFYTKSSSGGETSFIDFINKVRSDSVYKHIDWTGFDEEQKKEWLSKFEKVYDISTYLLESNGMLDYIAKVKLSMKGLSTIPDNPALLDLRNKSEQSMLSVSMQFIEQGAFQAALNLSDNMLAVNPKSPYGYTLKSIALQKTGKINQALEAAQTAVTNGPNVPDAHAQLGYILAELSQDEQAITELKEAFRLSELDIFYPSKNKIKILKALTDIYVSANNINQAIESQEMALDIALLKGRDKDAEEIKKYIETLKNKL